jgi:hypothetical protein
MDAFTGTLLHNGQVLSEEVTGRLSVDYLPNQVEAWTGFFSLPPGGYVELGDVLDLSLSDGRTGKIKIERVNQTSAGTSVSFGRP